MYKPSGLKELIPLQEIVQGIDRIFIEWANFACTFADRIFSQQAVKWLRAAHDSFVYKSTLFTNFNVTNWDLPSKHTVCEMASTCGCQNTCHKPKRWRSSQDTWQVLCHPRHTSYILRCEARMSLFALGWGVTEDLPRHHLQLPSSVGEQKGLLNRNRLVMIKNQATKSHSRKYKIPSPSIFQNPDPKSRDKTPNKKQPHMPTTAQIYSWQIIHNPTTRHPWLLDWNIRPGRINWHHLHGFHKSIWLSTTPQAHAQTTSTWHNRSNLPLITMISWQTAPNKSMSKAKSSR